MNAIFFTIVDPENTNETRLHIAPNEDNITLLLGDTGHPVKIDRQQLMELGALFLAIAGKDVDFESAYEVLDGFRLQEKGQEAAELLHDVLAE